MYQGLAHPRFEASSHQPRRNDFAVDRSRLRKPEIDTEPTRSPLDALVKGLVSIGERFRSRPTLRVL